MKDKVGIYITYSDRGVGWKDIKYRSELKQLLKDAANEKKFDTV